MFGTQTKRPRNHRGLKSQLRWVPRPSSAWVGSFKVRPLELKACYRLPTPCPPCPPHTPPPPPPPPPPPARSTITISITIRNRHSLRSVITVEVRLFTFL